VISVKEFEKPGVLRTAKRVLKQGPVCDHCLGRQLAQVSTGLTNEKRGRIIRKILKVKEPKSCSICRGIFRGLDKYAQEAVKKLRPIRFRTFLVSTRLSRDLTKREEGLWEETGIEYCEPLKSELNRELGKLLEKKTRREFQADRPDIGILLNLAEGRLEVSINPLFIYGEYRKLIRGIPQTKWDKYPETVEDIIAKPVMQKTQGSGHALHGAGREDIDARCLGWRPFVLEIKEPRKRKIRLGPIEKAVSKTRRVAVRGLRFSDRREVVRVKALRSDKTYRLLVRFSTRPKNTRNISRLAGTINQKTPSRVLHRRADLVRKRQVREIKLKRIKGLVYEITVRGEAGLYVKELVTGDRGRTSPSVSGLLKAPAEVLELDVLRIHTKVRGDIK
jgi:tRNA pseudouridine synthase 10